MKIRLATMADSERIAATHAASIEGLCGVSYEPADIAGWVDVIRPSIYENAILEKVTLVAEEADEVLGLGILDLLRREIGAIYVHPLAQGRGIGGAILAELERMAMADGADELVLCSTLNALGFYKRHGYVAKTETYHELPNGVRLQCVRMCKTVA